MEIHFYAIARALKNFMDCVLIILYNLHDNSVRENEIKKKKKMGSISDFMRQY